MTEQEIKDAIELLEDDFWNVPEGPCHKLSADDYGPIRCRSSMFSQLLLPACMLMWFLNGVVTTYLFFLLTAN